MLCNTNAFYQKDIQYWPSQAARAHQMKTMIIAIKVIGVKVSIILFNCKVKDLSGESCHYQREDTLTIAHHMRLYTDTNENNRSHQIAKRQRAI